MVLQMQCGPALFAQVNQNLIGESRSYLECCLWSAENLGSSGDDVKKKFPYLSAMFGSTVVKGHPRFLDGGTCG